MAKLLFLQAIILCLPLIILTVSATKKDTYLMLWGCSASSDRSLCLHYLRSDPRSFAAPNYIELGKIMAGFALAKANETFSSVKKMAAAGKLKKGVAVGLETCRGLYGQIIAEHIPDAIRTAGRSAEEGSQRLGDAIEAEMDCEKGFGKNGVKSPLTKRNNDFKDVVILAQDLWFLVWG
ncbi:unnamed protein product [Cuscuta epithymum]|uniref:Pectinesterase inhibitor domain-containing protein n=1 Tax=Cuscuta epithymum TaxID=186058 RepID=A0AAV0E2Q8_9ASTE|nr:unnamed protein product [Cuscuta epithymum]